MSTEFRTVRVEPLTQFCQRVFEKMGVPPQEAFTTTEVLVLADLRGIESHGVARLRRYYTGLKNGVMVPKPNIKTVHETPITALLDMTNGELLQRGSAHALLKSAAREAAAVAVAQGVSLPYPDPVVTAETIARRTADNRSTMPQDVQRGAPTEIDAICGAIVEAGERAGVPTPVNRTLWQLVRALAE